MEGSNLARHVDEQLRHAPIEICDPLSQLLHLKLEEAKKKTDRGDRPK